MSDQHESPIKTPRQLIVIVVLAFVIPIALILLVSQLVTSGEKGKNDSEEAVLARIQPVGKVVIAAGAGAPGAGAPAAAGGKPDGKKIYDTVCTACHTPGAAGAPKFGDKAAWAPRVKTGTDALYASALKGKNAMPPKGGNPSLSDADVKAAVDYIVTASK